jgi:hypothetical protein
MVSSDGGSPSNHEGGLTGGRAAFRAADSGVRRLTAMASHVMARSACRLAGGEGFGRKTPETQEILRCSRSSRRA